MASAEDEATKVINEFYDALEDLLRGRGVGAMLNIWDHGPYVATSHPFGSWARGWAEVKVTWEESAAALVSYRGHDKRTDGIGGVHDLEMVLLGDTAYGTGIYRSRLYMSELELDLALNCTTIAQRIDGVWKIVHHHADQAPLAWQEAIGRMFEAGLG